VKRRVVPTWWMLLQHIRTLHVAYTRNCCENFLASDELIE